MVLFNILLFVSGVLILEVSFGNWFHPNRLSVLNLMRDVQFTFDVNNLYKTNGERIVYKRDRYGLRGNYGSTAKIDVLTIGGSSTDQRFISEGATWQDVLQREFSTTGAAISIANAGIDGQSTYGHIKSFDWWFPNIPDLKVRYFLFYIGANDLHVKVDHEFDDLYGTSSSHYRYLGKELKQRSALYHLYRTVKGVFEARVFRVGHRVVEVQKIKWVDTPRVSNHADLMRQRLQSYQERLWALNYRVHGSRANAIYVTQAMRICRQAAGRLVGMAEEINFEGVRINGLDQCMMLRLLGDKTIEECRRMGEICVDLAGELEFDDDDFYDFAHNTPKGAGKIGRYLHEKLSNLF